MSFRLFVSLLAIAMPSLAVMPAIAFEKKAASLGVIVQSVEPRALTNNIDALGTLFGNESIVITAKATKTIAHVYFDDGQRVKKGELLVQMLSDEEAALMTESRLTSDEAKKQFERVQSLVKVGAVSASQVDQARKDYETANAHFLALTARFQDLQVRAPFAGVLGVRDFSEGSLVQVNQSITTLTDDSKMKLEFTVPAKQLRLLRKGQMVSAISKDFGGKQFQGSIYSIDNKLDQATRSIRVRALLDNADHVLTPGLMLSVSVAVEERNALVINEAALVPMASDNFVYVLAVDKSKPQSGWIAEKRLITLGARFEGFVEVLSGLEQGDKVVTHGLQKIHPGQVLEILNEELNSPGEKPQPLSQLLDRKKGEHKTK